MHANYEAVDGINLLGTEVLATMADDTVETIGVDESVNLVTGDNADFTTTVGDWVGANGGTLAIVSNQLELTNGSGTWGRAELTLTGLTVGQVYHFTADYIQGTSSNAQIRVDGVTLEDLSSSDSYSVYFRAATASLVIGFRNGSNTIGHTSLFDNVFVGVSGQLVANGAFHGDVEWTLGTGWTISGGVLVGTSPTGFARQTPDITIEDSYVITYEITSFTGTSFFWSLGGVNLTARTAAGTYTETITAISTAQLESHVSATSINIDNVSVRLAIPDLSSYADGIEVHGQLIKSAVNENATTVGYSNFSVNNYGEQPYNVNMDSGTGDFSIILWVKTPMITSSTAIIERRESTVAQGRIRVITTTTGQLRFGTHDGTTDDNLDSIVDIDDNIWHFICCVKIGGVKYVYVDSVLSSTSTPATNNTLSNTSAITRFGRFIDSLGPLDAGAIAVSKITSSGLTAAQIKTIYNKEKTLFQKESIFSIVGQSYDLDLDLADSTRGDLTSKNTNTSKSGVMETIVHFEKQTWNCPITPFDSLTFRYVRKFLRACSNNQVFTFDERGTTASPDNPFQAYLTSQNHNYPRDNGSDWRSASFSLREK